MTKTISERLREAYDKIGQHYGYVACIDEAADEIERLCAELEHKDRYWAQFRHEPLSAAEIASDEPRCQKHGAIVETGCSACEAALGRLPVEPNEAVQAGAEDSQVGSLTADSSPPREPT